MNIRYTEKEHTAISDEDIVKLYFERNENAIKETDKKYGKYLYAIAFNILSNNEDSEECLNNTYLKTWNSIPPKSPSMLKAFLAKIMRTTAIDCYDKSRNQKRVPAEMCESLSDDKGALISDDSYVEEEKAREIGRVIGNYLNSVSDRKLYIFMSRYYTATPISEIAEKLGCSRSTVNKELAAIKAELAKKLNEEGIII